jgi:beta-N-acetylhexosaminidase
VRRALVPLIAAFVLVAPESAAITLEPPRPADVKPRIVAKMIPFGARRKRQTAAYSLRHYGRRAYVLAHPHVVVEHYTDGTSFDAAWNHFASNAIHLGEKPGVCAHFVIDTDGTIYQLVSLRIRCRHAIGMNWTAIGIEHVGTSAAQILGNRDMMRASLRLTTWLMLKYGISYGNVIGHAETLQSPYHRERYDAWRCMTHADFDRSEMRTYRRRLKRFAGRMDVPVGAGPDWVDSGC